MDERISFDNGICLWAVMRWNPMGWWFVLPDATREQSVVRGQAIYKTRSEARECVKKMRKEYEAWDVTKSYKFKNPKVKKIQMELVFREE
jgi:hypothetical protein